MKVQLQNMATQVAGALRAEIERGTWRQILPGERLLAARLQVSRKTLRKALAQLRADGVLSTTPSCATVVSARKQRRTPAVSTRVALLLPEALEGARPFTVLWVNRLMSLLQDRGLQLEVFSGTKYYGPSAGRALHRLVQTNPACCWLLARSNGSLQNWFVHSGYPALVVGTAHAGVALPSVDIDHPALCRHAAGQFVRHDHTTLCLVLEQIDHAGDHESERGFREGLKGRATPIICRWPRAYAPIVRELQRLLSLTTPPTGFLFANSYTYLTVQSYLAGKGKLAPRDISLLARDAEPFLDFLHPSPALYRTSPDKMARALNTAIRRVLSGERSAFTIRIMPDFIPGASLGPAPKS
jgi:DNA-binding LacI/PurR family transcriptional regulator